MTIGLTIARHVPPTAFVRGGESLPDRFYLKLALRLAESGIWGILGGRGDRAEGGRSRYLQKL
ncbi:hypothetical protein CKA32_006931 [Geitlerinema sp. FC II]|nr:hypothetical protein [Geitlerinema sp. CS-897]PPT06799.1 hypothetical protein CKA32_006931 [Geitlerinema sp. FC II]